MQKIILFLLVCSILLLNIIYILNGRFIGLYYILWLGMVGWYVWKKRLRIEEKLVAWNRGGFKKFLLLGILMILVEEIFAGFSMHLGVTYSIPAFIIGILQFWMFNLFTLSGFIIAWYLLLRYFVYTRKEVFILVGLWGLYSEKIYTHIITFPIMAILLILPTFFTYVLIITPSVLSFHSKTGKNIPTYVRYPLGLIVPFIVSLPFIGILFYLRANLPELFPPIGMIAL